MLFSKPVEARLPSGEIVHVSPGRTSNCLEVTFQEAREHLEVETQKQWSDKAIARTTQILLALYTMVCLIGHRLNEEAPLIAEKAA